MMDVRTRQQLNQVRYLVETGWCQFGYARTEDGMDVLIDDERATNFCLTGAIKRVAFNNQELGKVFNVILDALKAHDSQSIVAWNDAPNRTRAEVLALIDKALAQ